MVVGMDFADVMDRGMDFADVMDRGMELAAVDNGVVDMAMDSGEPDIVDSFVKQDRTGTVDSGLNGVDDIRRR